MDLEALAGSRKRGDGGVPEMPSQLEQVDTDVASQTSTDLKI